MLGLLGCVLVLLLGHGNVLANGGGNVGGPVHGNEHEHVDEHEQEDRGRGSS
ncbi:MAG: hypothetical protein IT381_19110 [Deltaproteobacteria bacterium]|nr:hypothetical protein [Deltaproteobacteria bacterium]